MLPVTADSLLLSMTLRLTCRLCHVGAVSVCLLAAWLAVGLPDTRAAELEAIPDQFSRQWLHEHASRLAGTDFVADAMAADNPLRSLSYNDYRHIAFDPQAAVWRDEGLPFQLQLFHPGFLHTQPVGIRLVDAGGSRTLPFSSDYFDYHASLGPIDLAAAGGFAGFRVHYPINTRERHEEFLVFLGASYFRAVGGGQFYGLSARGLAVNTIGPGGEEFPRFSDFWVEKPEAGSEHILIHALMDSQSVTGAFHFRVDPGDATRMDVDATLYPRVDIGRAGIAPLTSMFLFDATNRDHFDDFRSAVHDSEGLQIRQANGETVWRPLSNPLTLQVSSLAATTPAGFGLLQRHQEFVHFNDDEARYDKRPSLWIEPRGDWGVGRVVLVEIPTVEETNDNIVAYWQPDAGLKAGEAYRYRYRMHWGQDSPISPEQGRITNTAIGAVPLYDSGGAVSGDERVFVVDFSDGDRIPDVLSDPDAVAISATTSTGTITDVSGTLVEATGDYRAYIKLDPAAAELAELRVTLEVAGRPWGETWLYRWTP